MPGSITAAPGRIEGTKLLIGEGIEDQRFLQAMLRHLGIDDIQVEQYGGKHKLAGYLKALALRSDYSNVTVIGITRDADGDAADAFRSVRDALGELGLPTPREHGAIADGEPKVGTFIFPDGVSPGMLEDLCFQSVEDDPTADCVRQFFKCVATVGRTPENMSKARVHAWLAAQEPPDKRLAEAAEKDYWPWDNVAFDDLKKFLRSL